MTWPARESASEQAERRKLAIYTSLSHASAERGQFIKVDSSVRVDIALWSDDVYRQVNTLHKRSSR